MCLVFYIVVLSLQRCMMILNTIPLPLGTILKLMQALVVP